MAKEIQVKLKFEGTATVSVPDKFFNRGMSEDEKSDLTREIASNIALAQIIASTNNPDAPMLEAYETVVEEAASISPDTDEVEIEQTFDNTEITEVVGNWYLSN